MIIYLFLHLSSQFAWTCNIKCSVVIHGMQDDAPPPTQQSQSQRDYVEGPSNHQQLLMGKAAFARLSQAHGTTVSGFVAKDVAQSQRDAEVGPAFISGGKKYVSLKNLGAAVAQVNKNKNKRPSKAKNKK